MPVSGTENDFLTPRRLADVVGEARGGEGDCVNFCGGDGAGKLRCLNRIEDLLEKLN